MGGVKGRRSTAPLTSRGLQPARPPNAICVSSRVSSVPVGRVFRVTGRTLGYLLAGVLLTFFSSVPGPWIEEYLAWDANPPSQQRWFFDPNSQRYIDAEVRRRWTSEWWMFCEREPGAAVTAAGKPALVQAEFKTALVEAGDDARRLNIRIGVAVENSEEVRLVPAERRDFATATGWPMRTALYREWYLLLGRSNLHLVHGFRIPGTATWSNRLRLVVPLRPLWVGLIFDVVFWSLAYIAAIQFSAYLRRRWRRGRGLCEHCGYDLRGTERDRCSECGGLPTGLRRRFSNGHATTES